jgi:hypothetical protein
MHTDRFCALGYRFALAQTHMHIHPQIPAKVISPASRQLTE